MEKTSDSGVFVVFSGEADFPPLRLLKKGFRHCFVLLRKGPHWVSCDPLLNRMEIELHDLPGDFDFPGWLRGRGMTVVESAVAAKNSRCLAAPLPFTCVEAVKRLLGIRAWWVVTPWQLYRYLMRSRI